MEIRREPVATLTDDELRALTEPEHHDWAVDIPPLEGDEWVNVATFDTREEAVAFVAERYGGEDGLVDLVTRL